MWLLLVSVIYLVNGEPQERQFRHEVQFASHQECMTRGRGAVDRFAQIEGVTGVSFVCAPAPAV